MLLFASPVFAKEPSRLTEYYSKAIPSAEGFVNRLVKDGKTEPWENLGVRALIDNAYVLSMAQIDLPEDRRPNLDQVVPLLKLAEDMQDKDPESPAFGNFRWYWRTPEVTDRNAVEFVAAHALPIWLEVREQLPPEARGSLERMLRRSVDGCLKHGVRSDYTNIAIYNFVHLILLGQAFDRPDAVREGEKRLQSFLMSVWDHGIFEYNSPTYYTVDVDALQLGLRYVENETTRQTIQTLLDYVWTDLALNWYKPALKHGGAQSRTYNYLYGVAGTTRLFDFAGLAPTDQTARHPEYLNSFHARYEPGPEILGLNNRYPRLVRQRWGASQGQWATSYVLDDIALATAGAPYKRARQNMVLTVDLADFDSMPDKPVKSPFPKNYFIADGREDPYGMKRYPTSSAGHQKALHMEAFWMGAQRTVDALGVVVYTPEALDDPVLTNVQSHFVFRKPDAIFLDGKPVELSAEPVVVGDKALVVRHGNRAFGIRIPWTRDKDGNSPKAYLIDDANEYGVYRLTINHWGPKNAQRGGDVSPRISYEGLKAPPGAAFWIRIGSKLDSGEKFETWCKDFATAKVEQLDVQGDNIAIRVAGIDGPVFVTGIDLTKRDCQVVSDPPRPKGILELDSEDLGRPILERLPEVQRIAQSIREIKSISVDPNGTVWEAESRCFSLIPEWIEKDGRASGGKAVRINTEFFWQLEIDKPADYFLWARVFAVDPQHDSFFVEWSKQVEDGVGAPRGSSGDWHIGSGKDWRWIQLKLNNEKSVVPMKMDAGIWRLTLRQREPDGMVDRFFLTTDPNAKPPE